MNRSRDKTTGQSTHDGDSKPRWLYVAEAKDNVTVRRSPNHPHLKVATTLTLPGPALEERLSRKGVFTRGDYVSVRYDLMPPPEAIGGRDTPADTSALMPAFKALRSDLESAGFSVNRRNTSVYRLYVCGLEKGCIPRGKGSSCGDLYVGQTSKTVANRIHEHLHGHTSGGNERFRSNKFARNHFVSLQQGLIPNTFPGLFFCKEHALRAESLLRLWLERDGYTVEGGTERYDQMKQAAAGTSIEAVLQALPTWPSWSGNKKRRRKPKQ